MVKVENNGLEKALEQAATLDLSAFSGAAPSAAQPSTIVSYITTDDAPNTANPELAEAARQFLYDAPAQPSLALVAQDEGNEALRAEATALLDVIKSLEPDVRAKLSSEQAELSAAAKAGRASGVDISLIRQRIEAAREEAENERLLETPQARAIREAVEKNEKAQEELDTALREAEDQGKIKDTEAYTRYKKLREEEEEYKKQHPDWMATEEGRNHVGSLQRQTAEAAMQATDAPEARQAAEAFRQSSKEMLEVVTREEKHLGSASNETAHVEKEAAHVEKEAAHVEKEAAHVEKEAAHVEKEKARVEKEKVSINQQLEQREADALGALLSPATENAEPATYAAAEVKEHGVAPAFPSPSNPAGKGMGRT